MILQSSHIGKYWILTEPSDYGKQQRLRNHHILCFPEKLTVGKQLPQITKGLTGGCHHHLPMIRQIAPLNSHSSINDVSDYNEMLAPTDESEQDAC